AASAPRRTRRGRCPRSRRSRYLPVRDCPDGRSHSVLPVVIRFLIADAYSVGGTIRTTFATAAQLARDHEVEVVSVYRFVQRPALELDPRVRLRCLTDLRPVDRGGSRNPLRDSPS